MVCPRTTCRRPCPVRESQKDLDTLQQQYQQRYQNHNCRQVSAVLVNLGLVYCYRRNFQAAMVCVQEVLEINQQIGDVASQCQTLGFWLGTWEGTIDREAAVWVRFFDSSGNLVLLPEEAAEQRTKQERQRADHLATRLRELGEDPNIL